MHNTLHLDRLPRTIELAYRADGAAEVLYVDQRLLPNDLVTVHASDWYDVVDAIKTLAVRGAPAIGIAGAAALVLWLSNELALTSHCVLSRDPAMQARSALKTVAREIANARPTAVNLSWAVAQVESCAESLLVEGNSADVVVRILFDFVKQMERRDEQVNRLMGANGATLLAPASRVLTHCNAGSLATSFYGTALGVVYAAAEQGKIEHVYADETRPVNQGARLTAWELGRVGIPCTVICDNMAASLMAQGSVDAVVVGADRIAANGDTANKIGTYGLAVLAAHHSTPFYVVAPSSTIDKTLTDGSGIPIEQRSAREVMPQELEGVQVWNPAFDVTPASLITRIVTERGVFEPNQLLY